MEKNSIETLEAFFKSEMKKFDSRLSATGSETSSVGVVDIANDFKEFKMTVFSLLEMMKTELRSLHEKIDDQENYTRRNCLLFHGIKEDPQEDTDQLVIGLAKERLGIDLTLRDIERSHRLGKPKNDKQRNRPIIARLKTYRIRNSIFANKKKLKGTNFMITESLSKERAELFRKTRDMFQKNCWTRDALIFAKVGATIKVIRRESDLHHYDTNFPKISNPMTLRPRPHSTDRKNPNIKPL